MKKVLVSFGGKQKGANRHVNGTSLVRNYTKEVEQLFRSAGPYGFDRMLMYDDSWLMSSSYYTKVCDEPSFGWMFKPASIHAAMATMDDGDLLVWMDSNDKMVGSPQPLFDLALSRHIYLHDHYPNVNPNKDWTRRDMFIKMGCDEPKYWDFPQVQVDTMVFHKDPFTVNFVNEWIKHASDYDTMIANVHENFPGYQDHRFEQSICSILAAKYGIPCSPGYPGGTSSGVNNSVVEPA